MSSNIDDVPAETHLLPKHTASSAASAASVASADISNPIANYRDLSTEDISVLRGKMLEGGSNRLRSSKRGLRTPLLLWTFFLALAVFSFISYWLLPFKMNQKPEFHPVFGDCGKTPSAARASGCIYDPLAVTWVRPECFYPELIEEFIDMEPVRFYHEKSLSKESQVPIEEIIPGQHEQVWAPHKFHSVHCAHVVKKVHHALANHLPIDSFSLSYAHTEHCQLVLLEALPHCAEPGTCRLNNVIQKYSSCGYVY